MLRRTERACRRPVVESANHGARLWLRPRPGGSMSQRLDRAQWTRRRRAAAAGARVQKGEGGRSFVLTTNRTGAGGRTKRDTKSGGGQQLRPRRPATAFGLSAHQ